ncbi:type VI secretion system-associated protein TagF [Acetobacteraceae bacterium]|nr:type VI secretion system-associated protein TagF [Acetobacteraceae bacterium]
MPNSFNISNRISYFGKLPQYGDFLKGNLPEKVYITLDEWISTELREAQRHCGGHFDQKWLKAPIYYFALKKNNNLFQKSTFGVWMPSLDKANRPFPFLLFLFLPENIDFQEGINSTPQNLLQLSAINLHKILLGEIPFQDGLNLIAEHIEKTANIIEIKSNFWWSGDTFLENTTLPMKENFHLLLHSTP